MYRGSRGENAHATSFGLPAFGAHAGPDAVVNALFQPPIVLARRLATLDRRSRGRLEAGLGQGWLPEEFEAVGVPVSRRGSGSAEHLAAMRACWGPDPVSHEGDRYLIPLSSVGPKPFHGRLPTLIGAPAKPAIERAAELGDGFISGVRDWDTSMAEVALYRASGGKGPVLLCVMPSITDTPDLASRFAAPALRELERASAVDVDGVHFGLNLLGVTPERQMEAMTALTAAL